MMGRLAAGDEAVTTRHLSSADLDRAGKRGARLAKASSSTRTSAETEHTWKHFVLTPR